MLLLEIQFKLTLQYNHLSIKYDELSNGSGTVTFTRLQLITHYLFTCPQILLTLFGRGGVSIEVQNKQNGA